MGNRALCRFLPAEGLLVGSIFGVATNDAASGASVETLTTGVVTLAKNSAEAWTVGELIYWDDTNISRYRNIHQP